MLTRDDVQPGDFTRRCVGRHAIERSTQALLMRVHRFGRHRATSPENIRWAARAIDGLTALLEHGEPHGERR
jgi:hypothetical protein